MPEQYKIGEKLRVVVEGLVARITEGEELYPGELTIALPNPAGLYDVTVPLDSVAIERLVPAEGEPKPGEIWRDKIGRDWFAYFGRYEQAFLKTAAGDDDSWGNVNRNHGPLTRVYPAPVAPDPEPPAARHGMATPELRLGDKWRDFEGDVWTVVDTGEGVFRLNLSGHQMVRTWEKANKTYGPLTRVDTPTGGA